MSWMLSILQAVRFYFCCCLCMVPVCNAMFGGDLVMEE